MLTQEQLGTMSNVLSRLTDDAANVAARIGGFWPAFQGQLVDPHNAALEAQRTALANVQAELGLLGTSRWLEVVGGSRTYEAWMGEARGALTDLQAVDASFSDWTLYGVLNSTAAATAAEVKKDATIGAAVALPLLLAVGGIYVLLLTRPLR